MFTRTPLVHRSVDAPMSDSGEAPVSTTSAKSTPTPASAQSKIIPHVRVRIGGLVALAGLGIALLSLYLPWMTGGSGPTITAIDLTEVLDLRAMMPINFLGLVVLCALVAITLVTRLGVFAVLSAAITVLVLLAHVAFVWVLIGSTNTSEPLISGLPAGSSVSYGPYISAVGFIVVIAGSVWAAKSAEYQMPDRPEGHLLAKRMNEVKTD